MLRERRPHRPFGPEANERSRRAATVSGRAGSQGRADARRAPWRRAGPRAGALVEEIAAARLPRAEPERAPPRAQGVRSPARRPLDVTSTMKPKNLLPSAARAPWPAPLPPRRSPPTAPPPPAAPLAPHSPIASTLAERAGRARRPAPRAAQGAPGRPARAPRLRAPRADVVAAPGCGASAARCAPTCASCAGRGGAPDVAIPAALRAIAACESGGNPRAVGGGGAFRGKYQFDYGTWAAVGGSGDPAARARGRAGPARGDALRARRLVALAGLRPVGR